MAGDADDAIKTQNKTRPQHHITHTRPATFKIQAHHSPQSPDHEINRSERDTNNRMPRFTDAWVVDKVMYTYVCNNGSASCLCCGAGTSGGSSGSSEQQLFLFSDGSGFEGIVNAMSDLETREEKDREIYAANISPWPSELRDRIWSDRLSLRFKMKRERKIYRDFFERVLRDDEYENGWDHHHLDNGNATENENNASSSTKHEINIQKAVIPILRKFCETELTPTQLQQIFQPLSTSSLVEMVKTKYKIGPAFSAVLCSVEDQVANFKVTGYGADAGGRSSCVDEDDANNYYSYEKQFEEQLHFTNKGFHLNIVKQVDHHRRDVAQEQWTIHQAVLLTFLRYMTCFASRTALLSRSVVRKNGQQLDAADGEKIIEETEISHNTNIILSNPIPSFRSDRRVIRLLIARYWADRLIEKYDEVQKEKKK